jgi:lon-related putative ATP-dependent protease
MPSELSPEKLRRECDPKWLSCETTEDVSPLEGIIGQERAMRALRFGLDIKERGFNVFVAGYPGTGRMTAVKDFLEEIAKGKSVPDDWCYVNSFTNPYEPKALKLPAGKGKGLQKDMETLIKEARSVLPKAFEGEDYAAKREATIRAIEQERQKLFTELNEKAQEQGFVIQSTPIGLLTIPVIQGQPLSDKDFLSLNPKTRDEIEKRREKLNADMRSAMRQLRNMEGKISQELEKLNRDVALYATGHLMNDLKEKYTSSNEVTAYIEEVQKDLLENLEQFLEPETPRRGQGQGPEPGPTAFPWMKELPFRKYAVNVVVDNSNLKGAPVVLEYNPTYQNLFGRIEKEAQFGVLTTDLTMIRAGSLHKANGGYLVVSAEDLLKNMFVWDGLKMAMSTGQISVEEPGERLGYIAIKGLRPASIPLDAKILLVGNPMLYYMFYSGDKDFKELFKVKADFDVTMDRTEENMRKYVAFICTFCRKENLKHLDSSAAGKIIEHGSRLAEDQEKLSTRFADVADIIREANFYASQENSTYINASHVKKAIEEKTYRSNLIQEKIKEMITRGFYLIDTESEVVGQVNGLSVMEIGDFAFGRPSRVTVSIGMGREGITDIEREAKMGGPIHTKGVLILSGYLNEKYAQDKPVSLSARLVFEQSYEGVEGDSASSTELYAILSAISGLPLKQCFAVTGSVNQKGEVQAIGGVNEKIEGFFEVCKSKGLTGRQGVMIPESNVQNLMLKEEIVETIKEGKFHIYPVKTIDQGIELLTGVKAGVRQPDGTFEKDTVNYRVNQRLKEMAEKLKEFPEVAVPKKKEE